MNYHPHILRVFLLISAVLFLTYCKSIPQETLFDGYSGSPTKIEFISFQPQTVNQDSTPILSFKSVYHFNKEGQTKYIEDFKNDSQLAFGPTLYFYNKKGLESCVEYYDLDGTVRSTTQYEYNPKGQVIQTKTFTNNKIYIKKTSYNKKPNKVNIDKKDPFIVLLQNACIELDDQGRKISMADYSPNGNLKSRIEFEYNEQGNEIASRWFNSQNELYLFFLKTYNSKNLESLIEEFRVTNSDTILTNQTSYEYKFDSLGNVIEKKFYSGKKVYLEKILISYPK